LLCPLYMERGLGEDIQKAMLKGKSFCVFDDIRF